jgi:transposase
MKKIDPRTLNQETQHELRKQIVRLRRKGMSNNEAAETVGISVSQASRVWQRYQRGGSKAITPGIRGRRTGEQRTLTDVQEKAVRQALIDTTPDQLKFPFALWTRKAVQDLIAKWYGITMPIRTVGEYLKRWGFTPQKPIKKAYEQKPEIVDRWLKTQYPQITQKAKKEKAEIYWGDETGIQNTANRTRGYAPKGTKPLIRVSAKKERVSMISAINNEGKVRFMLYREAMTSPRLITFMTRLTRDAGRKVLLILDNLRTHHSKKVTQWLDAHRDMIEVFYLPAYAPELNPDEYLNNDLKQSIHSGVQAHTGNDLTHKTHSFMRRLVKKPHKVKSYFRHPSAAYAAHD